MVDHASFASCGAVAAAGEPPRSYSASYSQASPSGDGGPQEIDSAPRSAAVTIARLRANRLRPTSCADRARFGATSRDAHSSAATSEIGRAHVRTPVTNEHTVCRLLLETQK